MDVAQSILADTILDVAALDSAISDVALIIFASSAVFPALAILGVTKLPLKISDVAPMFPAILAVAQMLSAISDVAQMFSAISCVAHLLLNISSAVAPALALPASAHLLSAIFNVAQSNFTFLDAAAAVLAAFHDLAILDAARPTVAIPDVSLPSAIMDAALSTALPDAALSMAIPDVAHLTMAILDAALSSAISDAALSITAILNVAFSFRIFFARNSSFEDAPRRDCGSPFSCQSCKNLISSHPS